MHALIDDQGKGFLLINTFTVEPERQTSLVDALRRFTEGFARTQPGFIAACVHAAIDGRRVVNYVQWEREGDLAAMLAAPQAKAHMAEVGALARHIDPVAYRVAYVGVRPASA